MLFIYIIRDPREVLVSYAVHSGMSIDSILDFFVSGQTMRKAKMESIVNWDIHYRSWKSFKSVPSMFIKFEDLLQNPKKNFHLLINFLDRSGGIIDAIEITNQSFGYSVIDTWSERGTGFMIVSHRLSGLLDRDNKNPMFTIGNQGHLINRQIDYNHGRGSCGSPGNSRNFTQVAVYNELTFWIVLKLNQNILYILLFSRQSLNNSPINSFYICRNFFITHIFFSNLRHHSFGRNEVRCDGIF